MRKKDNTDYYINRHSCFLLQYHIVFVTKYRHPVLTGKVKDVVYERIHYVADQRGFHILEINGESDHVHILMEADTTTSPAELANVLKTQTARKARKLYGETILKKYYWKPYFWSDSYFISSVSENSLHTIKQYIRNQGNDNVSVRTHSPTPILKYGRGTLLRFYRTKKQLFIHFRIQKAVLSFLINLQSFLLISD